MSASAGELIKIPGKGDLIGGQFLLEHEIGRGGFGIVFRARQLGVERPVAVKMLMPHAMTHDGVIERFKREARLASSLTHRNSVTIYAYGLHKPEENVRGLPYIAMEHLIGNTLQQFLSKREGKLSLEEVVDILKQSLASLAEAHKKGIIHRDIKPENIFLCEAEGEERVIKVLDFGIAKAVAGDWDPETRERLTRTGLIAGTAEYMAPEQATGAEDITPSLDVYAMGCIAFQLLTGDVPYRGNSPMEIAIKHISEPIPMLPEEHRDSFLEKVIYKAMAKEPRDRFQNAEEFIQVLEVGRFEADPVRPHTLPPAPPIQFPTREIPSASSPPALIQPAVGPPMWLVGAVIALLMVAVAVLTIFLVIGNKNEPNEPVAAATPAPPDPAAGSVAAVAPPAKDDSDEVAGDDHADGAAPVPANLDDVQMLADTVTIESEPVTAAVFLDGKALGETPLVLARRDRGDDPFEIEVRAKGYTSETVAVDWTTPPESGSIKATLQRGASPVAPNKGQTAGVHGKPADPVPQHRENVSNTNRRRRRGGKAPVLFDLGAGSKAKPGSNTDGKKEGKSPVIFSP